MVSNRLKLHSANPYSGRRKLSENLFFHNFCVFYEDFWLDLMIDDVLHPPSLWDTGRDRWSSVHYLNKQSVRRRRNLRSVLNHNRRFTRRFIGSISIHHSERLFFESFGGLLRLLDRKGDGKKEFTSFSKQFIRFSVCTWKKINDMAFADDAAFIENEI